MKKLLLFIFLLNLSFPQLRIAYDVAGKYAEMYYTGHILHYNVQDALTLWYDHIVKKVNYSIFSDENDNQLSLGWGIEYKFKREVDEVNVLMSFISPYLVIKFDIFDNLYVCNRIGKGYNYNISFDVESDALDDLSYSAKPRGFYITTIGYRLPNYQNKDNFEFEIGIARNYFRFEIDAGSPPPYNAEKYSNYTNIEYSTITLQIGIPIPFFN